ncbi:hypothetical protein [Azospirillum doebereinerae]
MRVTAVSLLLGASPSPPWGEGRGEGDAWRPVAGGREPCVRVPVPWIRHAARPPDPNPLPEGEREQTVGGGGSCP